MTNDNNNKHLQPANNTDFKQYSSEAVAKAIADRLNRTILRDRAERSATGKPELTVIKGGQVI